MTREELLTIYIASTAVALSVIFFVVSTYQWPVTGDAALMHYVAFAIHRGITPYVGVADVNLPFAYFPDWCVIGLFGQSDRAWRLYDFLLLAVIAGSMIGIAPRGQKAAGFWAGALFAVLHGRDGIEQAGQRDLLGTAFLMLALRLLFSEKIEKAWKVRFAFGLFIGAATMVKPTFAVFFPLFLFTPQDLRLVRYKQLIAPVLGFAVPLAVAFAWLCKRGALKEFFYCFSVLSTYHASLGQTPSSTLIYNSISPLLPLIVVVTLIHILQWWTTRHFTVSRRNTTILLSAGLAFCSYMIQAKGFPYQRYPFLACVLLFVALFLTDVSLNATSRWIARAALLWGAMILAPLSAWKAAHYDWQHHQLVMHLQRDLQTVSGNHIQTLDRQVLCLDSVSGCTETLYRTGLLSPTRIMYDEFLFRPPGVPAVNSSRAMLESDLVRPPRIVVLTSWLFPDGPGHYEKLAAWPAFKMFLEENYVLFSELNPQPVQTVGKPFTPPGYRLYVLRPR